METVLIPENWLYTPDHCMKKHIYMHKFTQAGGSIFSADE